MSSRDQSFAERVALRMAAIAGFNTLDEADMRNALQRLVYVGGFALALILLTPFNGISSLIVGIGLLLLIAAVLAGGLLLAVQSSRAVNEPDTHSTREPRTINSAAFQQALALTLEPEDDEDLEPEQVERYVLSRGTVDGRSYVVYNDGSIEMDTAFGTRWFASVDLAHEFIGFRLDANLPPAFIHLI